MIVPTAEVSLTQGKVALVDQRDFPRVAKLKWHWVSAGRYGYAANGGSRKKGGSVVYLHRFLLKAKKGQVVDHISGNSLDNRMVNLRIVDTTINLLNQHRTKSLAKSGYRGVTFCSQRTSHKKWRAQVRVYRKCVVVGYFINKEEARDAVNGYLSIYI